MDFNGIFDKNKYQELIKYLDTLKDLKYQEFQKKIVVYDDVIGVKTSDLKKIAKEISKNDYKGFIENNKSLTYEFVLLEGFIYGYLKIPFNELKEYLNNYLSKIKSWGQVDTVVSNLKIFKMTTYVKSCHFFVYLI